MGRGNSLATVPFQPVSSSNPVGVEVALANPMPLLWCGGLCSMLSLMLMILRMERWAGIGGGAGSGIGYSWAQVGTVGDVTDGGGGRYHWGDDAICISQENGA